MRALAAMLALACSAWGAPLASAQTPQAPLSNTPSGDQRHPVEPMPPNTGPTGNIDARPAAPPPKSITTPSVETSGASGAAPGQSEAGVDLALQQARADRMKPLTKGDVTYLCGGVGEEEADRMKAEARHYDMKLTFAAKDGAYLTDVNVDIRDARGRTVLQASCDSPILLVDLPRSGTYKVHAEAAGYALDRTAKVQARQGKARGKRVAANVMLVWPQQVAEAGNGVTAGATATGASRNAGSGQAGQR